MKKLLSIAFVLLVFCMSAFAATDNYSITIINSQIDLMKGNATTGRLQDLRDSANAGHDYRVNTGCEADENQRDCADLNAKLTEVMYWFLSPSNTGNGASAQVLLFIEELDAILDN